MVKTTIELPGELVREARVLAKRGGLSVERLIESVVAERVLTSRELRRLDRDRRRACQTLRKLLLRAPAVPPMPGDELPAGFKLPGKARARKSRRGKQPQ